MTALRALMLAACLCGAVSLALEPARAQAGTQADAQAGAQQANITTVVYFDTRSARLTAQAKAALDQWLQSTHGVKPEFILAIGHTDLGEGANALKCVKLSEARGEAVRAYLATKGVDATKVYVEGKGDTQPIAASDAPDERAKNRRVDVGMIGKRE